MNLAEQLESLRSPLLTLCLSCLSKGDYEPLPQGAFSAPLRNLVVRMLSVDPVKRPELDEVWSITQGIVQAQVQMLERGTTKGSH